MRKILAAIFLIFNVNASISATILAGHAASQGFRDVFYQVTVILCISVAVSIYLALRLRFDHDPFSITAAQTAIQAGILISLAMPTVICLVYDSMRFFPEVRWLFFAQGLFMLICMLIFLHGKRAAF